MAIDNISLHKYVEKVVVPKLKDKKHTASFLEMAAQIDVIGLEAFSMYPSDIIDRIQELKSTKEIDSEFKVRSEMEWLEFISNVQVNKYFTSMNLKTLNIRYNVLMSKMTSSESLSGAEIQRLKVLKDMIEQNEQEEDDGIVHYSQFYPPRVNDGEKYDEDVEQQLKQSFLNVLDYLEIDTDYTVRFDNKLAERKEKEFMKGLKAKEGLEKYKKKVAAEQEAKRKMLLESIEEARKKREGLDV